MNLKPFQIFEESFWILGRPVQLYNIDTLKIFKEYNL